VPGREVVEIEQKINRDLSSLNVWFIANKLNLNTVKSQFMMIAGSHHLTDPNLRPTLNVGGSQLKPVSCTKHLGIEIDSRFSWSNPIDKLLQEGFLGYRYY